MWRRVITVRATIKLICLSHCVLRWLMLQIYRPREARRCVVKSEIFQSKLHCVSQCCPSPSTRSTWTAPPSVHFSWWASAPWSHAPHVSCVWVRFSNCHFSASAPENLHRGGAERQADTEGPESCTAASQTRGTQEAAQSPGSCGRHVQGQASFGLVLIAKLACSHTKPRWWTLETYLLNISYFR